MILIRSPLHSLYVREYEVEFLNLINSDLKGIPFWDYSNFQLQDNEFGDLVHLNFKGAIKFSKMINSKLTK